MPDNKNSQQIADALRSFYGAGGVGAGGVSTYSNDPPSVTNVSETVRDYYAKKNGGSGNFGAPKLTNDQQIDLLPNASKLTKFERKVYGALPGVTSWMESKRIAGLTVSEQLEKFDKGWLGKALNFLDVGAEGFERAVGVGEQMLATEGGWTQFSREDLTSAWYAGSLYWDTANLPQLKYDKSGKVVGLQVPDDLPGVDGMVDARIKIKRLIESGVPPKEALAQVRTDYYDGLGALSLRATINDTWGHVLGDPANLVTAYIKPLEALKVRRFGALTTKLTGGVDEIIQASTKAADLMKTADNVEDALKYADEAYELANMAGDQRRALDAATSAAEAARKAGRLEDASRYERRAAELATMPKEAAVQYSDAALTALGKKQMNLADKAAIFLTGGDPLRPSKFGQLFEKVPIAGKFAKALQLTPESKARELLTLVGDNIGTNVIARMMNNPNAEADFVSYMRRVSKGASGVEYGHAMMTMEGKTVQSFTKASASAVEHMFATYQQLGKERSTLKVISDMLGMAPSKLLSQADEAPDVIVDMLFAKRGMNPAIDAMMASGELTTDSLRSLGKTMKGVPYNREMFFAAAMDSIETQAARQSVIQFGVKSKGVLTRWSDAMKAAESLAFLRLSPSYPFRNKINNEMTMLGRGLFGLMTDGMVNKFWDDFGVVPKRLGEAITPAQEKAANAIMSEADKVIEEALQGGNYGTPDKVKEFFNKINLGKLDTAKHWGQKIEQRASRRAFTLGTQQYLRKYNRPKGVSTYLNKNVVDAIEDINPEFRQHFDNAIRASGAMEKKFDDLLGGNLNLNTDSILDEVTQDLQYEVRDLLGDELLEHIHQGLPEALNAGTLDSFKLQTRGMMEKHVEDLFNKQIENVVEHIKAQTVVGGDNVWAKKLGEAQDIFWGAHIEHSIRMPEATRLAREASASGNYSAARALWRQEADDAAKFYGRAFKRVDAYIQGLEQGFEELGKRGIQQPVFGDVRRAFGEWQDGWKSFFTEKNRLMDDFWKSIDETPKGKRPPGSIDDVRARIQKMYDGMVEQEDSIMQRIDDAVAQTIDDPKARKAYMNARDTLAEMRKADKRGVNQMYKTTADMPAEEAQKAWNQFWQKRTAAYQKMRSIDAAGSAIKQGDQAAVDMFSQTARKAETPKGEFDVFKTAEKYGVETTTASGQRNKNRVKNTVNKYLSEKKTDLTGKAVDVPRSELPPAVSEKFELLARQMKNELFGGEAGKRVTADVIEGGATKKEWKGIGTTNVDWYRELYEQGLRKPAIDKAIDKIIKDAGADKGKTVERVKEIIMTRLTHGDPQQGIPPDLYALQELGASKKTMNKALDNFNDVTKQELTLEEALQGMTPSGLHDPAQPYYDEAGNLVTPSRFNRVEDITEEAAEKAFKARAEAKGIEVPPPEPEVTPEFIAEVEKVIPNPAPLDLGTDMMNYGRSYKALDSIIDTAKATAQRAPTMLTDLPQEMQDEVRRAIKQIKNDMSQTRYQALKFGEWRRDSALLNYNRRTNFDNGLGHGAPFVFWTTSSMFQWAIESIDRPAMLTNYLRSKRFMETQGLQRDGKASRAKGFRIELPFAPEWMGEQFIDPLRVALPFDNWLSPFEQMKKQNESIEGRTTRLLDQQLSEGSISQEEYDEATGTHAGAVWDFAKTKTAGNDNGDQYDAFDFATTLAAPHAPLMWAYNAATGNKESIGSFAPMSKIMRNAATVMGVEDWNNSQYNVEAKIRKQLGLPAYDKWDDYRIDRSLSNLSTSGEFTVDEVKEAMAISALVQQDKLTPEEAKEMSAAYKEGVKRSNQEFTGGLGAFGLGLLGIPVTSVPEGENDLRALADDFGRAYETYKVANDSLQDYIDNHPEMEEELAQEAWAKMNPKLANGVDDLNEFFEKNPEYETRLGLFDSPEERLHKFSIDAVWARWNELPKVNRDEVSEHLGTEFQDAFLNKDTRNYEEVPTELMSVWLKMMGTDPLGGLTADQKMLVSLYGRVQMTDPETANRVEAFYTYRKNFENWYDLQSAYYTKPKGGARKSFLKQNPELQQYWDFRRKFMTDNPDLVPYLTDNEQQIADAKNTARTEAAVPTAQELQQMTANMPQDLKEIMFEFAQSGDPLPDIVLDELEYYAQSQGLDSQTMVNILGGGMGVR